MTLEQVRREVEPQGFIFKESLDFLPWQRIIMFEKPADSTKSTDSKAGPAPASGETPSRKAKAPSPGGS
jgi:hypothetical protein